MGDTALAVRTCCTTGTSQRLVLAVGDMGERENEGEKVTLSVAVLDGVVTSDGVDVTRCEMDSESDVLETKVEVAKVNVVVIDAAIEGLALAVHRWDNVHCVAAVRRVPFHVAGIAPQNELNLFVEDEVKHNSSWNI